jgi:NADH-quinone oxidoreductase subunit H
MKFAMFFLGEYVGMCVISAFIVVLFLGGWSGPWLPPFVWFFVKLLGLLALFILCRAALPRLRFDQLMAFGWLILLPVSMANALITGAVYLAMGVGGAG